MNKWLFSNFVFFLVFSVCFFVFSIPHKSLAILSFSLVSLWGLVMVLTFFLSTKGKEKKRTMGFSPHRVPYSHEDVMSWREQKKFFHTIYKKFKKPFQLLKYDLEDLKKNHKSLKEDASFQRLEKEISQLSQWHNDLSVFQPEKNLERINLESSLLSVLSFFNPLFQTHNIEVEVKTEPFFLWGSAWKTKVLFQSLLWNSIEAVKNSPEKKIKISFYKEEEKLCFSIEDTGQGFSINEKKAFQPFVTTKDSHAGMGLSFIKAVVEEFQGELSVDRSEKGAFISVSFFQMNSLKGLAKKKEKKYESEFNIPPNL